MEIMEKIDELEISIAREKAKFKSIEEFEKKKTLQQQRRLSKSKSTKKRKRLWQLNLPLGPIALFFRELLLFALKQRPKEMLSLKLAKIRRPISNFIMENLSSCMGQAQVMSFGKISISPILKKCSKSSFCNYPHSLLLIGICNHCFSPSCTSKHSQQH